jgi:protein-tyrosine kinase
MDAPVDTPSRDIYERVTPKMAQALPVVLPPFDAYPVVPCDAEALRANRVIGFDSREREARPFTLMRSQILDRWRNEGCKLIGFTSATPAAGKSFIVSNLATSLALLPDIQIMIFDFDLRRGTVAENLQIEASPGLSEFLDGEISDLTKIGRRLEGMPIVVFPCAQVTSHSASLVSNEAFIALIESARRQPDNVLILCDLPPTFANDDAKLICEKLDGYVLVCEDGVTTRKQLQTAMDFMEPAKLVGTVLNRARGNFDDRYGYYSKAYKSYYK